MSARPSWAGGMAWFSQPCDFSVLPTLIPPPATPAILRWSRSLPEIGGLEIVQGFAWIFNQPFTLLFPLLSAVFAEWFLTPPRVRYQQHYTAVLSCRSWTLFALNLTGTKKVFLFIILFFFMAGIAWFITYCSLVFPWQILVQRPWLHLVNSHGITLQRLLSNPGKLLSIWKLVYSEIFQGLQSYMP